MKKADPDMVAGIIQMRKDHPEMPGDKIAERFGISKSMVNYHLRRAGYSKRSPDYAVKATKPKTYNKDHAEIGPKYEPATIHCLRCDELFDSWDRRENRFCSDCSASNSRIPEEETFAVSLYKW